MNDTPFRSMVNKIMVTLVIDPKTYSHNELTLLLRTLERACRSVGFSAYSADQLVWQIIVEDFDEAFWKKMADANNFKLYTHSMTQHW
jgi:hypothetical protein